MKLNKIKLIEVIFLFLFIAALNIFQKYLLIRHIEFRDNLLIIKMILSWIIFPFSLISCYHAFIKERVNNKKIFIATNIGSGIIIFIIIIFLFIRGFLFIFFEDKKEIPLENGLILVKHENFGPQQIVYYKPINSFLYKIVEEY